MDDIREPVRILRGEFHILTVDRISLLFVLLLLPEHAYIVKPAGTQDEFKAAAGDQQRYDEEDAILEDGFEP